MGRYAAVCGLVLTAALVTVGVRAIPHLHDDAARVQLPLPPGVTRIELENRLPGEATWVSEAPSAGIEGYAMTSSVPRGGAIQVAVSTSSASFDADLLRVGWYGGSGARMVRHLGTFKGLDQGSWDGSSLGVDACRTCQVDSQTGMLDAGWRPALTVRLDPSWLSGNYMVRLTASSGAIGYAYFVVTDEASTSQVLALMPTNTYEAHNPWGGKSLEAGVGAKTMVGGPAAAVVSFNRPYYRAGPGSFDAHAVEFLERNGLDVTYTTSADVDRDPGLLRRHKLFISIGQDEYWTAGIRDAYDMAAATGAGMIFMGGTDGYWQARLQPDGTGAPRRNLAEYRSKRLDPGAASDPQGVTARYRDGALSNPEWALTGLGWPGGRLVARTGWVVTAQAPAWLLAGTGLAAGDGIAGLVGPDCGAVGEPPVQPAGAVVVSSEPASLPRGPVTCASVLFQAPGGGTVFSAGTDAWADFLTNGKEKRVQRITLNVIQRALAAPPASS